MMEGTLEGFVELGLLKTRPKISEKELEARKKDFVFAANGKQINANIRVFSGRNLYTVTAASADPAVFKEISHWADQVSIKRESE